MAPETRPPNTPAVQWTPVTDITQQETYDTGPDGRPQLGYRISFTTPSGTRASVFVAASMYSTENARAAIATKAREIEGTHKLSS